MSGESIMKAIRLQTEYLTNPIGIDVHDPRLSWNCEGGITQTAYRIVAETEGITVWDSGKVVSSCMHVRYPKQLLSRQSVSWRVHLWDENDDADEGSEAFFETGLLSPSDWTAKWISGNYCVNKKKRYPVDCFKKDFTALDIKRARLYVTACGLYEVKINGTRVGNFVLAPGHTDYRKRIQYQTYDVTDLIKGGANIITAELADGWYRGSCGAWGLKNQYGTQTKFLAQLELVDSDGKLTRVCTDESWAWSNDGAIIFADNKDGEIVDARKKPTYSGTAKAVKCSVMPSASNNVYVTEHERFTNPKVIKTPKGKTVLDFGQNIAGYVSFTVKAKAGQKATLRFGEMLDKDGELTLKNIQCSNKKITTPLQKIEYTCKEGVNTYKTKFAVFGFQYMQVETNAEWKAEDFTAIAVYSDMEETLSFESSNELLNKFVNCTRWSAKNNSADVPTDCPTRERHGWTGDSQLFFTTAGYLFNYATFAHKHLRDIYDWQKKDGKLPQIAPYGGVDFYMKWMDGAVGWADAGILIPYRYYKLYNDMDILKEYYGGMCRYAEFMIKRIGKKIILSHRLHLPHKVRKYIVNYGQAYGEWAEPADVFPNHWTNVVFPQPEVSTAYTHWMMSLMAEIARLLGKEKDGKRFAFYAEKTKQAYRQLRTKPAFTLDTDRQATLVRPLYLGLLDEKQTEYAKKRLIKAMENYGWRIGTGFLSTPLILDVLAEIDVEYAYKLLENEEMPGWLFMPKAGATTIWESWEGTQAQGGIASLDHYSKGAVCEWLFSRMCGITVAGENKFRIAPLPGGRFTFAKTSYNSVYGEISCGWEHKEDKTIYSASVPANTSATLILPSGERTLTAGEYTFIE